MTQKEIQITQGVVTQIPVELLIADPDQPRTEFDEQALNELASDINVRGVQQPLLVRKDGQGNLWLKDGERRFRASQIAGLKEVPCLLANDETEGDAQEPLDRLFDQIAVNEQHKTLNPLDWARIIQRLGDGFEWSDKKIAEELEKRNLGSWSRSKVNNIKRLTNLPEWAQQMIVDGTLTAAHGKYLIPAAVDEKVLETVKSVIDDIVKDQGRITTDDLQDEILEAFWRNHQRLLPACGFDLTGCDNCPTRRTVSNDRCQYDFCLNKKCFNKKVADAEKAEAGEAQAVAAAGDKKNGKPKAKKPPKLNDNGFVSLKNRTWGTFREISKDEIDNSGCKGCEFNCKASRDGTKKGAAATCFNMDCYKSRQRALTRSKNRVEGVAQLLDVWVLEHVIDRLRGNHELQQVLTIHLALERPFEGYADGPQTGGNLYDLRKEAMAVAKIKDLSSLLVDYASDILPFEETAVACVKAMSRGDLYMVAHHIGLEITAENYVLDQAYVDTHNKDSALALLRAQAPRHDLKGLSRLKDMKDLILASAAEIGVPAEIHEIYAKHGQLPGIQIEGKVKN